MSTTLPPFEEIVTTHGPTVLRVCRAVLGPMDADDAWSETFMAALRAYPTLRPGSNVEAWLVTIAHRKAIDQTRARARRPLPVDPFPRMPHDGDRVALGDPVSDGHLNRAQMRVEAVVWASSKLVLNHDVPTVVRGGWNIIRVNHIAVGNGVNDIQRFPVCVPVQRPDVHPFVKSGIENGCPASSRVPDKSVLSALPRCADYSLEIPFDVLIERGVVAGQKPMIFCRQNNVDRLTECRKSEMKNGRGGHFDHAFEGAPSDAVTHKRFCWHRLGFATQGVIR